MRRKSSKRKIYIRNFIGFFMIYLCMMIGFSVFLVSYEKTVKEMEFANFNMWINDRVEGILRDNIDQNNQITDLGIVKKDLVKELYMLSLYRTEVAIYSGDINLIYITNDFWLCSYDDTEDVNTHKVAYGYINPKEWFSEQEIKEIEGYQYAKLKAEKKGDLTEYIIRLDGFWVNNDMIIPEKITVTPMYAFAFAKDGSVTSSRGDNENDRIYKVDYQNTEGLPHYVYGDLVQSKGKYVNETVQAELRQSLLNQEKIKKIVGAFDVSIERINLFTYRFFFARPYQNTVDMTNNRNYSEFWTVTAKQVNLWEECSATLVLVWGACFLIFFLVAIILSRQTVKTYQKRDQLEQQRQEMTNALAHDLKTPLSIISGYAQNLMENIHTEKREHYAGNIQDNVTRMDKIIKEMLEVSRLEAGLFPSKKEELSLSLISLEIMNRYQQVCEEKSITTCMEGDAVVLGDETFISRVIDNFYINALEHTTQGGTINIRIDDSLYELYNSSSHIPNDMLDDIWLPYIKVEKSRSNTKGTGLGLSIARAILDYYNYSYGVRNTEDGVVFWFQFKG